MKPAKPICFVDHPAVNSPKLQAIHHIGYENVAIDRQGVVDLFTSEKVKLLFSKKAYNL